MDEADNEAVEETIKRVTEGAARRLRAVLELGPDDDADGIIGAARKAAP